MKVLILLAAVLSLSLANEIYDIDNFNPENVKFELDRDLVDEFLAKYEAAKKSRSNSGITAIINEYADKVFANIGAFSLSHGLDPVALTNISQRFLTASITLNHGLLHGISTIGRSEDVQVTYRSSTKELELNVPIIFSNLSFTYDYHVIVLLIGPKGSMTGKIKNFEMDIKLTFDFNTYQATVKRIKTTNSGHVSLTFHGNGIVDVVSNILTEFVTTILQPLIGAVIEGIVSSVMNKVVDSVNDSINGTLHPSNKTFAALN